MRTYLSNLDLKKSLNRTLEDLVVGFGRAFYVERTPEGEQRPRLVGVDLQTFRIMKDIAHPIGTRIQGYGGGSLCLLPNAVIFSHAVDHSLYRFDCKTETVELWWDDPAAYLGDFCYDLSSDTVFAVRDESRTHGALGAAQIVAIPASNPETYQIVAESRGYFAAPRVSPDGHYLAWISWDATCMPWNASRLEMIERLCHDRFGPRQTLCSEGSSMEPKWNAQNEILFLNDQGGWWNPKRASRQEGSWTITPVWTGALEFGFPPYRAGLSSFVETEAGQLIAAVFEEGRSSLQIFQGESASSPLPAAEDFEDIRYLLPYQDGFAAIGSRWGCSPELFVWKPSEPQLRVLSLSSLRERRPAPLRKKTATPYPVHYLYRSPSLGPTAPPPPLIVNIHGGPTGMATGAYDEQAFYWLSQGYAYLDVNHRGSSGFGREYRECLNGHWGLYEVADVIEAVEFVLHSQPIDSRRIFVRGASAGGYTALRALGLSNLFCAGACYYGVSDLLQLKRTTHKFEAYYLDGLIGKDHDGRWRDRSPLFQDSMMKSPVIFFHGSEDSVVPIQQTLAMHEKLTKAAVDSRHVTLQGLGHSFLTSLGLIEILDRERQFFEDAFHLTCIG